MFELRWLVKKEYYTVATLPSNLKLTGNETTEAIKKETKVLQYRTKTKISPPHKGGYKNLIWTDWQDVPEVMIDG